MAFTDDFTGTAGQALSARAGWTLGVGEDVFTISSSGTLTKVNSSTGNINVYYRTDDASSTQIVGGDFLVANAPGSILFVLGSGSSPTTFAAYLLRVNTSTGVRVYRMINGVLDGSPLLNLSGLTDILQLELRAVVTQTATTLTVFSHGVQVGTFSDSGSTRLSTGRRGILNNATSSAPNALDNYYDNYTVGAAVAITPRAVPFVEGVLSTGRITYSGTYTGAVASIEARIIDSAGDPLTGFDWASKVASPTGNAYSATWTGLPAGGPYRVQVRDSAVPGAISTGQEFWVGAVLPINDQSIHQIMADNGKSPATGALTAITANRVFALYPSSRDSAAAAANFVRLNTITAYGSGYLAMADQIAQDWPTHIPIMFADVAYQGETMDKWINDDNPGGWPIRSGYATTMFAWCDNRITALIRPVVVTPAGLTFQQAYDQLIALYDPLLVNQPGGIGAYQVWVAPLERSSRPWDGSTKPVREGGYAQAIRGGRYRLLCGPAIGARARGDGEIHQADGQNGATSSDPVAHQQGNQLLGRMYGRGVASLLQTMLGLTAVDRIGPRIVGVDFTDATMTAIAVRFDRALKTQSGTTVALPQNWVTSNGWAAKTELTGELQSDQRTVVCPRPNGVTWSLSSLRYDYCRDTPWDTSGGANGGETAIQAKLDTLLHDTTAFNGGRGMPVMPEITSGVPVALPIVIAPTNASGSIALRVRQPS